MSSIVNDKAQIANRLLQVDLVIQEELGYLPFSQGGGAGHVKVTSS